MIQNPDSRLVRLTNNMIIGSFFFSHNRAFTTMLDYGDVDGVISKNLLVQSMIAAQTCVAIFSRLEL